MGQRLTDYEVAFCGGEWRHMRGDGVTFVEEDDVVTCDGCLLMLGQAIEFARTNRKAG